MENEKTKSIGCGSMLLILLFILFLGLKLAEVGQVANWSWWWVTSSLWLLPLVILIILGIVVIIYSLIK